MTGKAKLFKAEFYMNHKVEVQIKTKTDKKI